MRVCVYAYYIIYIYTYHLCVCLYMYMCQKKIFVCHELRQFELVPNDPAVQLAPTRLRAQSCRVLQKPGAPFFDALAGEIHDMPRYVQGLVSIDWCKGKITGNSHISWENPWFPEDFPLSQPIENSTKMVKNPDLYGPIIRRLTAKCAQ